MMIGIELNMQNHWFDLYANYFSSLTPDKPNLTLNEDKLALFA